MLNYCQTTLLLYMTSTICTLINLSCVIPLYLKFRLGLRIKTFGLLLPTFQERRTMMQMQNHPPKKMFLQKFFLSFNFNQRWTYLHQGLVPNYQCLYHTILNQRLCILMLFQYYDRMDSSMHFFPLL